MTAKSLLLAAAVLASLEASLAAAADVRPVISPSRFFESFAETTPLSGEVAVGLQCATSKRITDPTLIYVNLPSKPGVELVLEVRSQDGRYYARGVYNAGEVAAESAILRMPTKHTIALQEYRSNQLAVKLSYHASQKSAILLSACWEDLAVVGERCLMLNTGRAKAEIARFDGTLLPTRACRVVGLVEERVTYDSCCVVESHPAGLIELVIIRRYFDEYFPSFTIQIEFP